MKRSMTLVVIVLAVLGVLMSVILVPKDNELALMYLKDKHFDKALAIFRQKYKDGDHSLNIVSPLANLYMQYGDINESIRLLEEHVKKEPNNIKTREQLGQLYQFAQRPDDYLNNLEKIYQLAPTEERLRNLSDIYNFTGRYNKQLDILNDLINHYDAREDDYVRLAYLYAARKDFRNSAKIFDKLFKMAKRPVHSETMELAVSVYNDAGRPNDAFQAAQRYLEVTKNVKYAILLATRMQFQGNTEHAVALLEPFRKLHPNDPELQEEMISLNIAQGKIDETFSELDRLFHDGKMSKLLVEPYLELAITKRDIGTLYRIIDKERLDLVPEWLILGVAEVAIETSHPELARNLKQKLGRTYLETHPILDLALSLGYQDVSDINRLDPLMEQLSPTSKIVLARVLNRAGKVEASQTLIRSVEEHIDDESIDYMELAHLYLQTEDVNRGLKVFEKLRSHSLIDPQKTRVENAWLLLGAGAGRTDAILSWMDSQQHLDPNLLEDMYMIAEKYERPRIALDVARKVYEIRKLKRTQLYLAKALMMNNKDEEALPKLQELYKLHYNEATPTYILALIRTAKTSSKSQEELDIVLTDERMDTMPDNIKRDLAYVLLKHDQKDLSEKFFMQLAEHEPPSHPDVIQLLYLWGPNPQTYAKVWLEKRALASSGKELAEWLRYMNSINFYRSVIAVVEGSTSKDAEVLDAYYEALLREKHYVQIGRIVTVAVPQTQSEERLKRLASIAMQANQTEAAQLAYEKLHRLNPNDLDVIRELGMITYAKANYSEAKNYLGQYLAQRRHDVLPLYYYAEILNREKRFDKARPYYEDAEKLMIAIPNKNVTMRVVEANILYRLQRVDASVAAFKQVIREYPRDMDARVDYANILMELGKFNEAKQILSQVKASN